jgi:hypothetical protein
MVVDLIIETMISVDGGVKSNVMYSLCMMEGLQLARGNF